MLHLEIAEVVLINYDHQQNSGALYNHVSNKLFDELLDISHKKFMYLKTFNSKFSYIEVWFTDQNSKLLEIEDKIKNTLVIN